MPGAAITWKLDMWELYNQKRKEKKKTLPDSKKRALYSCCVGKMSEPMPMLTNCNKHYKVLSHLTMSVVMPQ